MKLIAVLLIVCILLALASAMLALIRHRGEPTKVIKALTLRVALSVGLFTLLMLAHQFGLIQPHRI